MDGAGNQVDGPEERLARLIDRLLTAGEAAAANGDWNRARDIAADVLDASPGDPRAEALLDRARPATTHREGQRAFVSLVFADIVRSTDLADGREPEIVRDLYRLFRQAVKDASDDFGGRVLQFYGDGAVACFGYPNVHGDDAVRSVHAGLSVIERMALGAPDLRRRHGVEASVRVGVHSGTVVVASLDDSGPELSSVIGVVANLAARLQSEAEPDTVVISGATRLLVEPHFELDALGARTLRGISQPVDVFRVVRPREAGRLQDGTPLQPASLVGRAGSLEPLLDCWTSALGAGTSVAVIRGPAGIGKSRLAAAVCERVTATGGEVLLAACSAYHTNVALWPIARMLEQRLGFYALQPAEERVAEVNRSLEAVGLSTGEVAPLLISLLGLGNASGLVRPEFDALALRAETLKALVDWLARFAETTPTLVLVEDVHWADPTTSELLGALAAAMVPGVMTLVTTREGGPPAWAENVHQAVDVELDPLPPDDAADLVAGMTAGGELSAEGCRLIVERGGGIPLFIQELARSALGSASAEALPPRLHELLAARLGAPGIDLRVAQYAAALGANFEEGILRELAGEPVFDALVGLQGAGIIEPLGDARFGGYRFRHVLLRDVAYETQVLDARRETHGRIARLLGATAATPGDLVIVAQHHDLAGDLVRSIPAYVAAARAAQVEASHTEARRLLDRSLELVGSMPAGDQADLAELDIRLSRSMSVSSLFGYGYPDVYEDFDKAERICRRLRDRPEIMPAQVGIWSYMLVRGDLDTAKVVLEPLAALARSSSHLLPEIKSCLGFNALYEGDLVSARRWMTEAWAGYEARSERGSSGMAWPLPHDPGSVTAVAMACVAGLEGRTGESTAWEIRAVSRAERIGFPRGPFTLAFDTTYLAWLRMIQGDAAGARAFGRQTLDIAEQRRFDYFRAIGGQYALVPDAEHPSEVEMLDQCEMAMDMVGHGAFRPAFLGIVARNHAYLGDFARALERVDEALSRSEKSGELVHRPDLLILRAEIVASTRAGRPEDIIADLRAAVDVGLSQGSLVLALRAANRLAGLDAERPEDWREVVKSVVDRFPADSASPELASARILLGT